MITSAGKISSATCPPCRVFMTEMSPFSLSLFCSLCVRVLILSAEPPAPRVGIEEINNKGAGALHVPGATVENGLQADYKGY